MTDKPGIPDLPADLSLLRRSCEPCTLREFCAHAEVRFEEVKRRGMFGKREPLARGERLFRPGDAQSAVYIVRSGALKTVTATADGEDCILGFHLSGELVGLDALASGKHQCEAVALMDSHVCGIPYSGLAALAAGAPDMSRRVLGILGSGAHGSPAHVQMLVRRQADERIAMFLLDMQQRVRRGGEAHRHIVLPMSREDVARYLGLALETVSRGLSRLQDLSIIAVSGRQIEVCDPAALAELAGSLPPECADRSTG